MGSVGSPAFVVEFAAALIVGESLVAIGRRLKRVPADQHGAGALGAVKLHQAIGKAENGAGGPVAIAQDIFRQCVISAMREGIAIDDKEGPPQRFAFV